MEIKEWFWRWETDGITTLFLGGFISMIFMEKEW